VHALQGQSAAAVNAEQLLRSAECVPELLALLEEEPVGVADFYVRFYTLDILKGLLAANAQLLQEVGGGAARRVCIGGQTLIDQCPLGVRGRGPGGTNTPRNVVLARFCNKCGRAAAFALHCPV
jgi:hypothetical protein